MATKMWSNLSSTKETGEMINLIEYYYCCAPLSLTYN